jgi:enoyl-CoA hydratase
MAVRREVDGVVAVLTLDRPQALNAINEEVLASLEEAIPALSEDDRVGAIVLTGAGGKAFAAGADISQFPHLTPHSAGAFAERAHALFERLATSPKPTVAAIDGYCLGGGLELALACDLRLASHRSQFGQPEVNLGLIPGWGGTQRLTRLVGPGWAAQLILTGERIDAETALRIGLVNELLAPEDLMPRALQLATRLGRGARQAVALAKAAIRAAGATSLAEGLRFETALWQLAFTTEDAREGVDAFLNKRAPNFRGR